MIGGYPGMLGCYGGADPMGIISNGSKARDSQRVYDNQMSFDMYLWRLMDIAMSVFDWRNLPDGIDPRMLEYWLLLNGFCAFFYDEDLKSASMDRWTGGKAPEGYAVLQCMVSGEWDMYNYPQDIRAYSVNGMNIQLTHENSVLIFNDYLRVPMFYTLEMYARRMAEIDRTIDVNVRAQKTPKVVRCDRQQRLTFENLAKEVDENEYWIMGDKSLALSDVEVLDLTSPYVGNELQILKHQYWNEVLTYLGVENVNTEKKERLVSDEVMSNMGDVEVQRFTRLNARKWACEQINETFGLDVDVDFRSGIYIKADGYGAQNIATSGMQGSRVVSEEAGYGTSDAGILSRLKALLGGGR